MAGGTHVWLAHPATGDKWECPNDEAVLAYFEGRGWTRTSAPEEEGAPVTPEPQSRPKPKPRSTN
jgi:hypothetical protein